VTERIGIVVTTHNRPEMLRQCLESILESASRIKDEVRLVVIDDGSDDYEEAQSVVHFLDAGEFIPIANVGLSHARMVGLNRLTDNHPEFYAFFDDDDAMLPTWFERHLEIMEQGYDIVSGSYFKTDADLNIQSFKRLRPVTMDDLLAGKVSANDQSLLRTATVPFEAWEPEMGTAMPMTMWLEMAWRGRKFGLVDEPTWLYRQHGGSMHTGVKDEALREQAIARYR
jgi:glycosyltransferase involved in cell wall biosynthesis